MPDLNEDLIGLTKFIEFIKKGERKRMWNEINSLIKTGELNGDGTDKIAERNGLILARNKIFEFGI